MKNIMKKTLCAVISAAILLPSLPVRVSATGASEPEEFLYEVDYNAQGATTDGIQILARESNKDNLKRDNGDMAIGNSTAAIVEDNGVKVLNYNVDGEAAQWREKILFIPLKDANGQYKQYDVSEGSFTLEIKMKAMPLTDQMQMRGVGGFATVNDGTKGSLTNANDVPFYRSGLSQCWNKSDVMINANNHTEGVWMNKRSETSHCNSGFAGRNQYNNMGGSAATSQFFSNLGTLSSAYYTYKWEYTAAKDNPEGEATFRFSYFDPNLNKWVEPYKDFYMAKSGKFGADITAVDGTAVGRFSQPGILPAGNLPEKLDYITMHVNVTGVATDADFKIASFKLYRLHEPKMTSSSVTTGVPVGLKETVSVNFDRAILDDRNESIPSFSKDNIQIVKVIDGSTTEAVNADNYEIALTNDNKTVTVTPTKSLSPETDYRIEIEGLKADSTYKPAMTDKAMVEFTTMSLENALFPVQAEPKFYAALKVNEAVSVNFDKAILDDSSESEATFTKANVKLFKVIDASTTEAVDTGKYDIALSADEKTVIVTPADGTTFDFETNYRIVIEGLKAKESPNAVMEVEASVDFATVGSGGNEFTLDWSEIEGDIQTLYTSAGATSYDKGADTDSSFEVVTEGDKQILKYTLSKNRGYNYDDQQAILKIPLGKEVNTSSGVFTVEMKMKAPKGADRRFMRGVGSLGGGNVIYPAGLSQGGFNENYMINAYGRSDGLWMIKRWNESYDHNSGNGNKDNNFFPGTNEAERKIVSYAGAIENFYTYRWNYDADAKTFTFEYDDGTGFKNPYEGFYMIDPAASNAAGKAVRYKNAGVFPTGTLPEKMDSVLIRTRCTREAEADLIYEIEYVKVTQLDVPAITGASIDGRLDYVKPDEAIEVDLSREVLDVTKENVQLSKLTTDVWGNEVATPVASSEYSAVLDGTQKTIIITPKNGFEPGASYRVTVKDLVADTFKMGKMVTPKNYDIRILKDYETRNVTVEETASNVELKFDFVDYVAKHSGDDYTIIAALVEKATNITAAVDLVAGTSTGGNPHKDTPVTLNLTKPAEFAADAYEVRLYVWDKMVNSKVLYRTNSYDIEALPAAESAE